MRFSGKLVIIAALAVTVLLVSNIIAIKPIALFQLPFSFIGSDLFIVSVAIICFPIGYIISDVLTEVYGFRVARGVIWLGFLCNLLMVFLFWLGDIIPGVFWSEDPAFFTDDAGNPVAPQASGHAYTAILLNARWILLGSFVAYIIGEFTNATVMTVMKNKTQGRMLWLRTIASTVVGQGIDSILFFTIAFGVSGLWVSGEDGSWARVFNAAVCAWIAKSVYEIVATPLTYLVVGWLKRTEQMDAYDSAHSLNPFGVFGDGPDRNAAAAAPRTAAGAAD